MMRVLKNAAWRAGRVLRGGGAAHLTHKRGYHVRRDAAERAALAEARHRPGMLRANVCPACGSPAPDVGRFVNPLGAHYATCAVDGTVFMDPVWAPDALVALNNGDAESYGWKVDESVHPGGKDEYDALRRMHPDRPGCTRLLDVGCATGAFLLTASAGYDVVGLELNDATAAVARRAGLDVVVGKLEDLPGDAQYDVLTMLQVVEHLIDPVETLSAARRLLKPGGHLYLSTPCVESASFAYLGPKHNHVSSSRHVSLFTRKGLERLAQRAAFEIVAHEYWGGSDFELHDAISLALAPGRFRHRRALYSERLYHAATLIDDLTGRRIGRSVLPHGTQSYQRALLRRAEPSRPD